MIHRLPTTSPSLHLTSAASAACRNIVARPSYFCRVTMAKVLKVRCPGSEPPAMRSHRMQQSASLSANPAGSRRPKAERLNSPHCDPYALPLQVFHSVTFPSAKVPIYTCSAIKTVPATHIPQLQNEYERARMVQILGKTLVERLEECLRRLPRAVRLSAFVVESTRRIWSSRSIHA